MIGGSFAKSLRHNKISEKIYAYDLDPEALENAIKSGVIDDFVMLDEELSDFDFIVLASPLSTYEKIVTAIKNKIAKDAVIIDLGSIKNLSIKKKLGANFIPCHPIAGSEKSGFDNSDSQLFAAKKFIICPENCDENSLQKVVKAVQQIGAEVEFLAAKNHDEIYALVSHLPQFLSFLTKDFSPKKITEPFLQTAFRLDNSDPQIWSDIFKLNENNLEKFYLEFFENLERNCHLKNIAVIFDEVKNLVSLNPEHKTREIWRCLQENKDAGEILFRALVVKSYLEIAAIKTYKNYAGSGFRDFTSIIEVLDCDAENFKSIVDKNHQQIKKIFQKLTTN